MRSFRHWDKDGNGNISKAEFRRAIRALGSSASRAEVDRLFDSFDTDKGGTIEAKELGKALRRGGGDEIQIAAELHAGAKGEIEVKAKNRMALRRSMRDGATARTGREATIPAIRAAMREDLLRVKDLLDALDQDKDGHVSRDELRAVLPLLGFDQSSTSALDGLFDALDADQSGSLEYNELYRALRRELEEHERPEHKEDASDVMSRPEEEAAAIKLQALQRGRKTRKTVFAPSNEPKEEEESLSLPF